MPFRLRSIGFLVLVAACSGGGSIGPGGPGTGVGIPDALPPDSRPPEPLEGTERLTYIAQSSQSVVASDLTTTTIEVLIPDAAGGFQRVAGSGRVDGTFTVGAPAGLPAGPVYLRVGKS